MYSIVATNETMYKIAEIPWDRVAVKKDRLMVDKNTVLISCRGKGLADIQIQLESIQNFYNNLIKYDAKCRIESFLLSAKSKLFDKNMNLLWGGETPKYHAHSDKVDELFWDLVKGSQDVELIIRPECTTYRLDFRILFAKLHSDVFEDSSSQGCCGITMV